MKGQRKAMADIALRTADAGYLTRRLVDVAQNLIVMSEDCNTQDGIELTKQTSAAMNRSILDRAYSRYLCKDIVHNGEVLAKKGQVVDIYLKDKLEKYDIESIWVRSSSRCSLTRGVCQKCYGLDFSTHRDVKLGTPIGIIAAQSLGEPGTQLTMRSKHLGGVERKTDITEGLPRVEELLEARIPKITAPISLFDGLVSKIEGSIDSGYKILVEADREVLDLPYNPGDVELLEGQGNKVNSNDNLLVNKQGELIKAGMSGIIQTTANSITIRKEGSEIKEYKINSGLGVTLKEGDRVYRGQALAAGPLNLVDVLENVGLEGVQNYIIEQLIGIYTSNGIVVNEKHIEVIMRQMCAKVQVVDPGDSEMTIGDIVNIALVHSVNSELEKEGRAKIIYKRSVIGISRASLSTESFLSAASFQETARVLVEAVISGRVDHLLGLKENVILGQLIPAGTAFDPEKLSKDVQEEFEMGVAV